MLALAAAISKWVMNTRKIEEIDRWQQNRMCCSKKIYLWNLLLFRFRFGYRREDDLPFVVGVVDIAAAVTDYEAANFVCTYWKNWKSFISFCLVDALAR